MPPAADWIASSKQASASYVGKLEKSQGPPETVGKLANGSRPSCQRLREKKNYFSFHVPGRSSMDLQLVISESRSKYRWFKAPEQRSAKSEREQKCSQSRYEYGTPA